jgi:hypothetical protein
MHTPIRSHHPVRSPVPPWLAPLPGGQWQRRMPGVHRGTHYLATMHVCNGCWLYAVGRHQPFALLPVLVLVLVSLLLHLCLHVACVWPTYLFSHLPYLLSLLEVPPTLWGCGCTMFVPPCAACCSTL